MLMNNNISVGIIKTSDMSQDMKDSIVDMMMLSYGPCYICGHKPIITACIICHEMTCEDHIVDYHISDEKLKCINCKNKEWDGKQYTLGDILDKRELK